MPPSANQFRTKRFSRFRELLEQTIAETGPARVLDVGGTIAYWESLKPLWADLPVHFTIVNLDAIPSSREGMDLVAGNACALDEFSDNSFDLVHSNSVIEHVGQWPQMKAMAREVRRLAPRYYLQTPNMWFPVELHYKLPFIHWLPPQVQAHLFLARKGRYVPRGSTYETAYELTETVRLLTERQLKALFPDATIEKERYFGFTKSLIAIKG